MDNGALGLLSKPIDPGKVMASIEAVRPKGIVLVAEDDPDFRPAAPATGRNHRRSCDLVTNGLEALARFDRGGVEILILDLNMPLIDGIEVYTELRRRGKAVPTVMITACRDRYADALEALSDVEYTGILHKPLRSRHAS